MADSVLPFDDRDGFIWYDGRLVPWRDAKLHVLTHGLHYASCVFEGERVYNGRVFRMEDHNERLINSAKILGFEIPYSVEQLTEATRQTIRENKFEQCYIRRYRVESNRLAIQAELDRVHVQSRRPCRILRNERERSSSSVNPVASASASVMAPQARPRRKKFSRP